MRTMGLVCLVAVWAVVGANADIVEIGPFVGQFSEDLENVAPLPGIIDERVDVLHGDITFLSLVGDTTIHLWSGSSLGGDPATPRSGVFLIGATTEYAVIFNVPVTQFGAYFTNNSLSDDATVTFFDAHGKVLDAVVLQVPGSGDADWHWSGWSSDEPIGRLEIFSNGVLNGFIWLDDLEVTQVGQENIGDLNGDGLVNAQDLARLLGSWGPCAGCLADLNNDEIVNAADLAILLGNWG